MKSIILHYSMFNQGGAEKSTLRLIKLFVKNGWDVTLLLNYGGGLLEKELPKEVTVTYLSKYGIEKYKANFIKEYYYRFINLLYSIKVRKQLKKKTYDIACVGLQGLKPKIVCDVIKAKKKILFVRTDISNIVGKSRIVKNIKKYQDKLDNLICVSTTAKNSIVKEIPTLKNKAVVIYNVLEKEGMLAKLEGAKNPYKDETEFNVVTVCRMVDSAKALFRSLNVFKRLIDEGYSFQWYFVGEGADLEKLKARAKELQIDSFTHFEGAKLNPFPYYKYASLVAVLSYYEGLCGVVNEAKVSGAAVIATEFSGIYEQITNGVNGVIVENNDDAIYNGLKKLLNNREELEKIKNFDYPEAILNDDYKYGQIINL